MIVLIAPENDIPNEIEILHQLFQEGLQYYHFRKPNKNYQEHCDYLNQIDKKYHDRIVVHFFHELINEYNLKGIHFQEAKRRDVLSTEYKVQSTETFMQDYAKSLNTNYSVLKTKNFSSSFHEPSELEKCEFEFDYHLLSPVFSSISKEGYQGRGFDVNSIAKTIIGMGGVTAHNLEEFDTLGYHGVGVLGGVWNSKSPISDFKKINSHFIN